MVRTGRYALLEQFRAEGVTYMFGNPGTVEQGFLDALLDFPDITYVETLQETIAVAIADGYARTTQRPAVVQLHSGVGLGNGIGMLYQAKRGNAPLVVIAGESGIRYDAMDAQMAADLVAMASPVTKWATRVVDPTSLLRVMRRAFKMAMTAPMGPVFVSLPMDVLDAINEESVFPASTVETRIAPDPALLTNAAKMLAGAANPMIIMGDGIAASNAQEELSRVAETLGADVWGANSSEVNISTRHPLYAGSLGHMFGEHSSAITSRADAVLICGTYVFPEVFPALSGVFAPGAPVIHIDLDPYEIGKNFPVDLGILADPKTTLGLLAGELANSMTQEQSRAALARMDRAGALRQTEIAAQRDADDSRLSDVPMHAATFMRSLADKVPTDVMIFDEALTSSPDITHYMPPTIPGRFFQTRGGSLGVGFPGGIGLKMANPERTVLAFAGDGGSMYTIQALWTAAHHEVGAKFIVCNNRSYQLLKLNLQQYWVERDLPERDFPAAFDIANPAIQFVELAHAMGVDGVRVERPDQIGPAIDAMLADDRPFLIELVISSEVPGHEKHMKAGQS